MEDEKKIDGFEDSTYSLSDLPIIVLGQPLSPAVMDGNVQQGDLYNSVTLAKMGDMKNPVELVVYKAWPSRTKFNPRGSVGPSIDCSSPDGVTGGRGECKKCPFNNFQMRDRCTEQRCFIVAPVSEPSVLMRVIFSRSTFAIGRKLERILIAELKKLGVKASYGHTIKLGVEKRKNEKSGAQYFAFTVELGSPVDADAMSEMAGYGDEAAELRRDSLERAKERMASGEPLGEGDAPDSAIGAGDGTDETAAPEDSLA
jgi:hypothetical protein